MKRVRIALALAAVMALSIAGASSAVTVAPNANDSTRVGGNPGCPAGSTFYTLKLEDWQLGVGTFGAIDITAYDGKYVSWKINKDFLSIYDADVVIVKGGPTAMLYFYDKWDDADTNLRAPINPNNGKPYGISHVSFCFDPKA
jgi:hypothetical protein